MKMIEIKAYQRKMMLNISYNILDMHICWHFKLNIIQIWNCDESNMDLSQQY